VVLLFLLVGSMCCGVGSAFAAGGEGPVWAMTSVAQPSVFARGGTGEFVVTVTNAGSSPTDGSPITVTDELPKANGFALGLPGASGENPLVAQKNEALAPYNKQPASMVCEFRSCTYSGVLAVDGSLVVRFPMAVSETASATETNVVRVSGGGANSPAAVETATSVAETQTKAREETQFGIAAGSASTSVSTVQGGAHSDLTTSVGFNTTNSEGATAGDLKDLVDDLPPGFAGDLVDTPACGLAAFLRAECAIGTQIGVITLGLAASGNPKGLVMEPVYNLVAAPGQVARFGFSIGEQFHYEGNVSVRPGDYGLQTEFFNATAGLVEVDSASLTVWGVPADPVHDPLRWSGGTIGIFGVPSDQTPAPFFTNPTTCGSDEVPLEASISAESWQTPGQFKHAEMSFGPISGCDRLGMEPALTAEATTDNAYAPTGLDLNLEIPQTYGNAGGLATSALKRVVIKLPEGMTINPSAGAGLGACTQSEYEEEPVQATPGIGCPSESKLGTIKVVTPSLKEEVTGSVYVAQPYANPFDSLIALYVVARIPERGVLLKFAGDTEANPETGQLTTTFDDLPPLPFSLSTFRFNQGQTSPLVTPPTCGLYTVHAELNPWSNPLGAPLQPAIAPFPIANAFNGGECPATGLPPFNPQLTAYPVHGNAGAYSPFYLRLTRSDGEQEITGFSSQLPPGFSANLSGVPFCPEADIALARAKTGAQEQTEPSCPASSEIGYTEAGAGVGEILARATGKLYMAGPFEGAPFSIVSITAAKVGPFDLGTVVVHLPLAINPLTAAVTVGPGAPDQIPHIIKGIVIHIREIRAYINRANFTLNPTSCEPASIAATVIGSGKTFNDPSNENPVNLTNPFQAADCRNLEFKPTFTASTAGKTSKANGTSLTVKLTYPKAPLGTQANIKSVKVDLPIQMPSRLTTLQKACLVSTFNANPANCPSHSIVGHATATTPILPVPLTGPAYFVSHGGAKFPELVILLQGYGITIQLHGETFISKAGITSSTFHAIPDQPVTNFELTLPQGPYSALAANLPNKANHSYCGQHLIIPTAFTAQNGVQTHQNTKITVTGCPKPKKHTKQRHRHHP
jgi:hypothetical protein